MCWFGVGRGEPWAKRGCAGGGRWSDKHVGPFKCCVYGLAIYGELGDGWAGVFVYDFGWLGNADL